METWAGGSPSARRRCTPRGQRHRGSAAEPENTQRAARMRRVSAPTCVLFLVLSLNPVEKEAH